MPQPKSLKDISSNTRLRKIMKSYYLKAKFAWLLRKKIAWITSGGPVELLIALGVTPIYPENHGAMIGATKMGAELSDVAEQMGYSRDLCSYFRTDVGQAVTKKSPIGGLPRPDFLLCCNNICGTVLKWYEVQARYFNVPLIILDTPYNYDGETKEIIDYVSEQFKEIIPELEKVSGRRFSEKKFIRVGEYANEAIQLWNDILSVCEHKPAPMTCFDAFFYLAPIVTLRGTKIVVDYYKTLKKELYYLAEQKISPYPEEKFRLVWDNLPIWYKMRRLSHTFANYGACLVGDTYTNAWADNDINPDMPYESMARAYATVYLNRNVESRIDNMIMLLRKYKADGFVMHSNRSCKPYSFGQLDIKNEVTKRTGLPGLIIEADMTDNRAYSDEQVETRIQAFVETLTEREAAS
jgi:bcr-type benzoyl-CoA reductase subunit B